MVPKERVESPLFSCVAGRQGRQPQLDCGVVAILVRYSLGPAGWTAGLQEPLTRLLDDGIVPGRLVAGIFTLLDGVAIGGRPVGTGSRARDSRNVISDCFQLFANSRQQPRWMLLLVAISRLSQLSHRTWNVLQCQAWCSRLHIEAQSHAPPSLEGVVSIGFRCRRGVGAAVDRILVRKEAFTRPHSPVCATFKPRLSLLKKLVMDAPQKLPTEPTIGPLKPLPCCLEWRKMVRSAVQSARCDPSWDNADQALAEAHRALANL